MGLLTQKRISFSVAIVITCLLSYQIIISLAFLRRTVSPELYLNRIAISLMGYFFSIITAWLCSGLAGGLLFSLFASAMVLFVCAVSRSSIFVWYLLEYAGLCVLLLRLDQNYQNQIAVYAVDREKTQNEKNDLEVTYKVKGEGISIFFEKYSTYYNLRKLAEELATTLSVVNLCRIVINRAAEFIPRGDHILISLADPEGKMLSVAASKNLKKDSAGAPPQNDLFDAWAIKNRKRLIVMDAHEDFRFDLRETVRYTGVRSLILAPLLHEGRVIGTLRMNASQREAFTNDDLRVLDTIAVLASSALSNAMLYEKTKELAIRDSLTGLYVRRYFFERLAEEHRRALLNNRPMSLLMCDLDHFKDCNDRFGHGVGDLILTRFARILRGHAEGGVIARYGGEEFAILLPETTKDAAHALAEKIRKDFENSPLIIRREKIRMTVSMGVANIPEDTLDAETLIQKSDQALYAAKKQGRNRVCLNEV